VVDKPTGGASAQYRSAGYGPAQYRSALYGAKYDGTNYGAPPGRRPGRAWNWLLAIPIIAPLLTPLYNRVRPELWGVPFFYWYQLGCALLAVGVITAVYQLTRRRSRG
jgi:hypothetical protein